VLPENPAASVRDYWSGALTSIASLRCDALIAPFAIDAPMDRRVFETYVETQLAPTLKPGDAVILDNLPAHKSADPKKVIRARALGSPSFRPIASTSIQSRWFSQS
jgi:hypothetical protein